MSADGAPLRLLVAGAGAFGGEQLARRGGRADVVVVGVADPDPAALDRVRQRHGAATYHADPLRLIDGVEADALIIAAPAASHVEICVAALGRNLCVLLEKPIAPSAASAASLVASARVSKGFVLPGHVLRFSKDHARLVEIVRSGRIGEVLYVNARRYRDESHAVRYSKDDPILMTMIHDIDLAQWITGSSFLSVLAHRSAGGFRSMTAASAVTTTGVICDLRTAWTFAGADAPPDRLEVVGDRGGVELTAGRSLEAYADGRRVDNDPCDGADDPLKYEQDHFLACVRDRTLKPALDLDDALAGLKLADAALESLRAGVEVLVPE
jgi:predicted dehydrogenase